MINKINKSSKHYKENNIFFAIIFYIYKYIYIYNKFNE